MANPGAMQLLVDPGRGNTQLNALLAAVLGPQRVAHGVKRNVRLDPGKPQRIANLGASGNSCSFVALFLPESQQGPLTITIGPEAGDTNLVPARLESQTAGNGDSSFTCVLLPGESLYAQSPHDTPVSLLVSEVYF